MWELDYKESWAPKNWCFWTVVLEKTLESPLDCQEIKSVNLKGNQSWIFIRRSEDKLKLQYFGHLMRRPDSLEKTLAPWKESYGKPRQCVKMQRHHFASKGLYNQSYGFSRSHVWMWELDRKEFLPPKNWCFLIVVLEKTFESPLDCQEIKSVNPEGNQPWIFIGRTDAESLILWPPDAKNQLTGKDPDAGKDQRQKDTRAAEDEMVR